RRHTRSKRDWSSDLCSSDLDVESYRNTKVKNYNILYSGVVNKLRHPKVTSMKSSAGGFIGGYVVGHRSNDNVRSRSLISLDIDDETDNKGLWTHIQNKTDFASVMYSTHRST